LSGSKVAGAMEMRLISGRWGVNIHITAFES
jgi:hypothetical protein